MARDPISLEDLLSELRDATAVVAASPNEQLAWCLGTEGEIAVPVDEIMQSFTDMVFAWNGRLRYCCRQDWMTTDRHH